MSKSKEEIIKAVDDLQKRVEGLEAGDNLLEEPDLDKLEKYKEAVKQIADLKAKIKAMEDKVEPEPKDEDFGEDW